MLRFLDDYMCWKRQLVVGEFRATSVDPFKKKEIYWSLATSFEFRVTCWGSFSCEQISRTCANVLYALFAVLMGVGGTRHGFHLSETRSLLE